MPAIKKCVDCGNEYQATSNVQKRCTDCKGKMEPAAKKSKNAGRQSKAHAKVKGCSGVTDGQHESVAVLQTLVAIGAVTEDQVEATRRYVREMFVPTV